MCHVAVIYRHNATSTAALVLVPRGQRAMTGAARAMEGMETQARDTAGPYLGMLTQ